MNVEFIYALNFSYLAVKTVISMFITELIKLKHKNCRFKKNLLINPMKFMSRYISHCPINVDLSLPLGKFKLSCR